MVVFLWIVTIVTGGDFQPTLAVKSVHRPDRMPIEHQR